MISSGCVQHTKNKECLLSNASNCVRKLVVFWLKSPLALPLPKYSTLSAFGCKARLHHLVFQCLQENTCLMLLLHKQSSQYTLYMLHQPRPGKAGGWGSHTCRAPLGICPFFELRGIFHALFIT